MGEEDVGGGSWCALFDLPPQCVGLVLTASHQTEVDATACQIEGGEPAQPVSCTGDDSDWPRIHPALPLDMVRYLTKQARKECDHVDRPSETGRHWAAIAVTRLPPAQSGRRSHDHRWALPCPYKDPPVPRSPRRTAAAVTARGTWSSPALGYPVTRGPRAGGTPRTRCCPR